MNICTGVVLCVLGGGLAVSAPMGAASESDIPLTQCLGEDPTREAEELAGTLAMPVTKIFASRCEPHVVMVADGSILEPSSSAPLRTDRIGPNVDTVAARVAEPSVNPLF